MSFLLIVFSFLTLSSVSYGSLINSATGIEYLLYTEDILIESFDVFFQEQEEQLEHLKTEFLKLRAAHKNIGDDFKYFSPLDRFQLTKRFTEEWDTFIKVTKATQKFIRSLVEKLSDLYNLNNFLTSEDLKQSAESIFEVQNTFNLNAQLLANGVFTEETVTKTRLTADHCYDLGYYAMQVDKMTISADWIREVFPRLNNSEEVSLFRKQLENAIVLSHLDGHYRTSKLFTHILTELDPDFKINDLDKLLAKLNVTADWLYEEDSEDNYDYTFPKLLQNQPFADISPEERVVKAEEERINFKKSLCRGELVDNSSVPFPVCQNVPAYGKMVWGYEKEEIVRLDPLILQFNELVTTKEAENMIATAKLMLISYETEETGRVSNISSINTAVLEIDEHPFLKPLDDRIRRILRLKEANIYHEVVDRGFVNVDSVTYYDHKVFDQGDYIGSLLIFLNEPLEGGYTIFPELKLRIKPVANTGIYWPNDPDKVDWLFQEMEAVECPLLVGFKWYDFVRIFSPKKY